MTSSAPTGGRALALVAGCLVSLFAFASCATTLEQADLAIEYFNIGTAYFDLGDLERSATYLTRAIALDPSLERASYNLARVRIGQSDYDGAVQLLEELLMADEDNSLVLETLGYASYLASDLIQAGRWYDRALDVNPTDPDLLRNRAIVHRTREEYTSAATLFQRAIDITGETGDLVLEVARTFRLAGDSASALESYERYIGLEAEAEPEARYELAGLYEEAEFFADALEMLEPVIGAGDAVPSLRADASFASARILLLEAEEIDAGIDAARNAFALGFSDVPAALELAEQLDPETRDRLMEVMDAIGLGEGDDEVAPEQDAEPSSSGGSSSESF